MPLLEEQGEPQGEGNMIHSRQRATQANLDMRRGIPAVKPAKMNIPEFDGTNVDSWLQTIELYFDSARTPLENRTEVAVTYLKGDAIQWWRGTGYSATNLVWHRFCRFIEDRFTVASICDNVRNFHALTQTATVSIYIQKFEAAMNLMRRDNPGLPESYYVNSFISGLSDYIQAHLQCHPTEMQRAMWLARRIEQAQPQKKQFLGNQYTVRRHVQFDTTKPTNASLAAVIQEATAKNVCYKCREPWFPGHKKVCKINQRTQAQALHALSQDTTDIIYITEADTDSEEEESDPTTNPPLQISMHAVMGQNVPKYTFTVTVLIGDQTATALVDSGSTSTFMTPACAQRAQCSLLPSNKMKVIVADGGHLYTEFSCSNCNYTIQGVHFQSDFRILKLKGYDLILGADWI
uniref:Uncharacterized protein n=1 Tax=Avena sativa TaxID=4498 RepID=A0ACD6AK38_AVESA